MSYLLRSLILLLLMLGMALSLEAAITPTFFRIGKDGNKWCFLDPQGKRFFSTGVCVVNPSVYLPDGKSVNDQYGSVEKWALTVSQRLADWDFNTLGAWSNDRLFNKRIPYTVNLGLSPGNWQEGNIPDFWSSAFSNHVNRIVAREVVPRASDPMLIGYYFDNEMRWGIDWRGRSDLFAAYFALPANTSGKIALVQWLRLRYGDDAAAFNRAWGMSIKGFDDLLQMSKSPGISLIYRKRSIDRHAFTNHVAQRFFQVCHDTIRIADPSHLLLGVRFVSWVTPRGVVREIAPYTDVVSVNHYEVRPIAEFVITRLGWLLGWMNPEKMLIHYYEATGKPVIITEFYFRSSDSGLPNSWPPRWLFPVLPTQKKRADRFESFARGAYSCGHIVGYHWFAYMDEPKEGRFDGENSNIGLVDSENRPWGELTSRMKSVNRDALLNRGGQPCQQ